jgi:hypothetical protein
MNQHITDGVPNTAAVLRNQPVAVLDLRGNGGGSDSAAYRWLGRFTDQPVHSRLGVGQYREHGAHDESAWACRLPGSAWAASAQVSASERPAGPYEGALYVITDAEVASSGETFVALASQVRGATVVGENTMGCGDYGNVERVATLPNSLLKVQFGRTKFVFSGRPFVENSGFFPDFWLDTEEPLEAIAAHVGVVEGIAKMGWANPRVVATTPASGAIRVDPSTTEVSVTFNEPMSGMGMAIVRSKNGDYPETGEISWSDDMTILTIGVKLEPNKNYAMWFNYGRAQGLRNEKGLVSVPFELAFSTGPKKR